MEEKTKFYDNLIVTFQFELKTHKNTIDSLLKLYNQIINDKESMELLPESTVMALKYGLITVKEIFETCEVEIKEYKTFHEGMEITGEIMAESFLRSLSLIASMRKLNHVLDNLTEIKMGTKIFLLREEVKGYKKQADICADSILVMAEELKLLKKTNNAK